MSSLAQCEITSQRGELANAGRKTLVACICGGYGFPYGTATTQRILLVGKALVESGCQFTVWHCGPSPTSENKQIRGEHEGIEFEYLGNSLYRPVNKWRRILIYSRAMVQLPSRIHRLSGHGCVYLYPQGGVLGLYAGMLCKLLRTPVVQELGEWWDGVAAAPRLAQYSYRGPLFWLSDGALVISDEIARRVLERTWSRKSYRMYKLPAVVDPARWENPDGRPPLNLAPATFLWCGLLSGYLADIRMLLESLALVREAGVDARLILCGPCDERAREFVTRACERLDLEDAHVILTGYLSQKTLASLFQSVSALVLPMYDDDRSWTRSPNKLPEYLASGTPVITSAVGDIGISLRDLETAYFVRPGAADDFAAAMVNVARDPACARKIGLAGREVCESTMDYRLHSAPLAEYFSRLQTGDPAALRKTGSTRLQALRFALRKGAGWTISSGMIAAGVVRRRLRQMESRSAITPLYFHNPSAKVFRKCIERLMAADCAFLSLEQVSDFVSGRAGVPKRAVWLSCDDGWKEIALTMLPLLRRYHLPMTIFVPTDLVLGGPAWWRVCRIYRRELMKFGIRNPEQLWEIPNARRREIVDALCEEVDTRALGDDFLSREQIQAIARCPEITIGSHSCSHPLLWRCTDEEVRQEMAESKRVLDQWIGRPVTGFAYPFGYGGRREADCARAAGYQVAATTFLGTIEAGRDAFRLPRFCVSDEMSIAEAVCSSTGAWSEFSKGLKRHLPKWALPLLAFSAEDEPDSIQDP